MPMPLFRRAPDYIAGTRFDFRLTFALHPAAARGDKQCLSERMPMPSGARARLKRDARAAHACWVGCFKQWINPHRACEIFFRPFGGRRVPFLLNSITNPPTCQLYSGRATAVTGGSTRSRQLTLQLSLLSYRRVCDPC